MGCQQCGRRPGDLYCLNDDGCPNDPQYEPRQDWACEPAPTGKDLRHYYCYETPCKECAAEGVTGNVAKEAALLTPSEAVAIVMTQVVGADGDGEAHGRAV